MVRRLPSSVSAFTVLVFVFLYLPIVVVVINSVNADKFLVSWGGFTTKWYAKALSDERIRTDFITSAKVAIASSLISVAIAVAASLWARNARVWSRRALDATTYMRIVLPEVVLATALFIFVRRLHFELGVTAIVIGHVVFNSAYATVVIQARLATLPISLEEAATDLGATPWRVFRRVTFPLLAPAILVAGLLTFSFSFDDVVTSLFLGGTNAETLPVLLLGLIRISVTPEVNAIAVGVMLITLITFACARRGRHRAWFNRRALHPPSNGCRRMSTSADQSRPPAIALEQLERHYGELIAVAGIDLEIADGEFFSLIGPSGCGKTTTLRIVAGPGDAEQRQGVGARPRRDRRPRLQATGQHRVPALCAVPAPERVRERRLRAARSARSAAATRPAG